MGNTKTKTGGAAKKPNDVSIEDIIAYQDGVRKALEARDVALLK